MCRLKADGGRCHAHLKQIISSLSNQIERESTEEAKARGIAVDESHVAAEMKKWEQTVATTNASIDARTAECKEAMLTAHDEALAAKEALNRGLTGKEILHNVTHSEAVSNLGEAFGKKTGMDVSGFGRASDIPELQNYSGAKAYVEAFQYTFATAEEQEKAKGALWASKAVFEKGVEKEILKGNIDLRAQRRRMMLARANPFVSNVYEKEKAYEQALLEAKISYRQENGRWEDTSEYKAGRERIKKAQQEHNESISAFHGQENALQNHLVDTGVADSTSDITAKRRVYSAMENTRERYNYDYRTMKAIRSVKKFQSAREEYVKWANVTRDGNDEYRANMLEQVRRNAPRDPVALKEYQESVYAKSSHGREKYEKLDVAKHEIIQTRAYRNRLKKKIETLETQGQDASTYKNKLMKIEALVARNKAIDESVAAMYRDA